VKAIFSFQLSDFIALAISYQRLSGVDHVILNGVKDLRFGRSALLWHRRYAS